jgi:hypothetical protein
LELPPIRTMANATAGGSAVYDRQMLWEVSRHRKQQEVALTVDAASSEGCTFEPNLVSKQILRKKAVAARPATVADARRGPASQSARSPGSSARLSFADHVARYERGRKERKDFEAKTETARLIPGSEAAVPQQQQQQQQQRTRRSATKLKPPPGTPKSEVAAPDNNGGFASSESLSERAAALANGAEDGGSLEAPSQPLSALPPPQLPPPPASPPPPSTISSSNEANGEMTETLPPPAFSPRATTPLPKQANPFFTTEDEDDEEVDGEEETFFEQLQRERRQWQRERARMQKVIELQQEELGKRGDRTEKRALDIATAFTSSISTFEQRVITIETTMQSTIKDLRAEMKLLNERLGAAS